MSDMIPVEANTAIYQIWLYHVHMHCYRIVHPILHSSQNDKKLYHIFWDFLLLLEFFCISSIRLHLNQIHLYKKGRKIVKITKRFLCQNGQCVLASQHINLPDGSWWGRICCCLIWWGWLCKCMKQNSIFVFFNAKTNPIKCKYENGGTFGRF